MNRTAIVFGLLAGAHCVCAQTSESPNVFFNQEIHVAPGPGDRVMAIRGEALPMTAGFAGGATFEYVGTEIGFGGKPVKGAPYSAEGVTESTQTLPDGNRITHKTSALYYRDAEGRTRTEQTLGAIGPWASGANPPKTIFISDPVAGVNYVLNPHDQSADKLPAPNFAFAKMRGPGTSATVTASASEKPMDIKTESLGTQTIEGVLAEGTRTVVTIPAGQIGNERDLQTVSERWYSTELQTVILRKQTDPRFGDTVYRLTNIQRGDQPASLFEVPADFTVHDVGPPVQMQYKSAK